MFNNYLHFVEEIRGVLLEQEIPDLHRHIKIIEQSINDFSESSVSFSIIDYRLGEFLYTSNNVHQVHGYSVEEIRNLGPIGIMNYIHPEDRKTIDKIFVDGTNSLKKIPKIFLPNLKIIFNFRYKVKSGEYAEMQIQQKGLLFDNNQNITVLFMQIQNLGEPISPFTIHCKVQYKGPFNKWISVYSKKYLINDSAITALSQKEIEIIQWASKGLTSKEIAVETNKSVETVNKQRKIILEKMQCASFQEVIGIAYKNNWIE